MSVIAWVIAVIAGIALLAILGVRFNRKRSMLAFGQGVSDAGALSWTEVESKYRSYHKPMRPLDAAAYRRGVEYCMISGEGDTLEQMKRSFHDAWSTGAITQEGNEIRTLMVEPEELQLDLRVSGALMAEILRNKDSPPQYAKLKRDISST